MNSLCVQALIEAQCTNGSTQNKDAVKTLIKFGRVFVSLSAFLQYELICQMFPVLKKSEQFSHAARNCTLPDPVASHAAPPSTGRVRQICAVGRFPASEAHP
jgi:hypothetical protein